MDEGPVLSPEQRRHLKENGYVVVPTGLPPENLRAVVDLIWSFLGMDPENPDDWYREPHRTNGMVEVYQHQALWDNRQHPRLHALFRAVLGTGRLWVSMDRACMKPPRHPAHPEYDHRGFIHWDTDTSVLPQPFRVQGVLCLTDTDEDQGGFQCVPELYRRLEEWIATQPADRNPRVPDLTGFEVTKVPARAGEIILWDRLLPHGNGHNVSDRPRLAHYITMYPAREEDVAERERRIRLWRERLCPGGPAFPGDPRRVEELQYETARLTPLGERLLGLRPWPEDST